MKTILTLLLIFTSPLLFAQTKLILVGDVKDAVTNEPLAYATIGVKGRVDQTISDAEGKFELSVPASAHADTLIVTYVGYEKFQKPIPQLASFEHIVLKEYTTVLDEVRIVHRQFDARNVDRVARIIRGNLYALDAEVTNSDYNNYLAWLEDYNKAEEHKRHSFKLDGYPKSVKDFYLRYHKPSPEKQSKKDLTERFDNYPAVNITHESAAAYCQWLTDRYNESTKKKKFKKVLFRLPTLKEWQIAALGYAKFQSWDLKENEVDYIISDDSTAMATSQSKGTRKKVKVNETIWYPWFWSYYYRNKPYNLRGCFMGNFKVEHDAPVHCPVNPRAYDGFTMMSFVRTYWPNDMGLYDVVGNVAEMIDEKGKACGGSWNDVPEKSTIQSVKTYNGSDETVGFRVFMEVIEK